MQSTIGRNVVYLPSVTSKNSRKQLTHTRDGRPVPKAMNPFYQDDVNKLIEHFNKTHDYRGSLLLTMGCTFAVRISDLLNIKIKDVYNERLGKCKDHVNIYEQKTGKSNYINVPQEVKDAVDKYLNSRESFALDDYLFWSQRPDDNGNHQLKRQSAWKMIKAACIACGLDPERHGTHSLRKTFGAETINRHPNDLKAMVVLQKTYNHSDQRSTMHYVGELQKAVDTYRTDVAKMFHKPEEV